MECEIPEEKIAKNEKKEKIEKNNSEQDTKYIKGNNYKIIKNRSKNNLLNLISYIIYNRNNFKEKLKPSDLEIIFETDSNISTYNHFSFKTKLLYNSFNPNRDILNNIPIYQQIPAKIEMIDEYYTTGLDDITVEIVPEIKEGIILDISRFPFFMYDKEILKEINKNDIKFNLDCEKNMYNLCVYISDYSKNGSEQFVMIENIMGTDMFLEFFKNIVVIIQLENQNKIYDIKKDEKLSEYLNKKDNNKNEKIKILFNVLSCYNLNLKENKNNFINIFQANKKIFDEDLDNKINDNTNYFFILDSNNKIVEIKPLYKLGGIITFRLLEFKKNNKDEISIYEKKKNEEKKYIQDGIKLIHFINNLKKLNLNYIFKIKFNYSFVLCPNDELTELEIKKINQLTFDGDFFTKECEYLSKIKDNLKGSKYQISFTEMKTKDIDIDFSNMECDKCKEIISEDSYLYYCYICKAKYCYECVQLQLKSKNKKDRYIDKKHHLLFFKTKDINDFKQLEEVKLGKNRFVECPEDDLISWNSTRCNGCQNSVSNLQRYLCCSCRKGQRISGGYIDFCSLCIDKMCKDKKEKERLEKTANEIIDNFGNFLNDYSIKVEHHHDKHIYLMMPFQVVGGGYDEF